MASLLGSRDDLEPDLGAARALVSGKPAAPWYGDLRQTTYDSHHTVGHAPQYIVLLVPLALVPAGLASAIARVLALVLASGALVVWARISTRERPWWIWLVPLSTPVVTMVRLDQLMTAIGLVGLTLAVALHMRKRWFLVGACCALGLVRTTNALPVVAYLVVVTWAQPRALAMMALGALAVLAPLTAVVQVWDGSWLADYAHNLAIYQSAGIVRAVRDTLGLAGQIGVAGLGAVVGAALAWRDRGRSDPDRAALALAIGVITTIVSAFYVAVFALPALIRVALRREYRVIAVIALAGPWVVIIATAPLVLASPAVFPPSLLSIMALVLVPLAYPLLRRVQSSAVPR